VYDEKTNMTLNIQFVCACGERVVDLGNDDFECLHCDRFCDIKDCQHCDELEKSDVETFLKSLEEGDDDADL
jgi:hypothetical protein